MTDWIITARELGLLGLLIYFAYWLGRHAPGATMWLLKSWQAEQEKNRAAHREIQSRMDERAAALIKEITSMCRYRPPEGPL